MPERKRCQGCGSERVTVFEEARKQTWLKKQYTYVCLRCGYRWTEERWSFWG
jgi:DNA-directed RNA polymerase subunit M/transcription elongation factor TFIIS